VSTEEVLVHQLQDVIQKTKMPQNAMPAAFFQNLFHGCTTPHGLIRIIVPETDQY